MEPVCAVLLWVSVVVPVLVLGEVLEVLPPIAPVLLVPVPVLCVPVALVLPDTPPVVALADDPLKGGVVGVLVELPLVPAGGGVELLG
jgi:hypothetical protein